MPSLPQGVEGTAGVGALGGVSLVTAAALSGGHGNELLQREKRCPVSEFGNLGSAPRLDRALT